MHKQSVPFRFDFKASEGARTGEFAGLAAVFGNVDFMGDAIAPGAFAATLAAHKARGTVPALLWSHDPGLPIGKFVDVHEDSRGLYVRGQLSLGSRAGAEAHTLLKDGAVGGLSIGFTIPDGGAEYQSGVRVLKQIDLMEVSIVAVPANPEARVSVVKSALDCGDIREFEHLIRERLGLSARKAAWMAGKWWPTIERDREGRDDDREDRAAEQAELAQVVAELRKLNTILSTKGKQ